jgi:hypothetical protein
MGSPAYSTRVGPFVLSSRHATCEESSVESDLNDVTSTIQFSEQVRGGLAPAEAAAFRVDASGFHDAGGVGTAGQEPGALGAAEVAGALLERFDVAQLRALFGHFVRVYEALPSAGGSNP